MASTSGRWPRYRPSRPASCAPASARSRKTHIGGIIPQGRPLALQCRHRRGRHMRLSIAAALLACCACTAAPPAAPAADPVAGPDVSRRRRWSICRTPTIAPPSSGRPPTPSGSTSSPTATRPTATTTPPTTSSRPSTAARTWTRRCTSRAARRRWIRCRWSGSSARPTWSTSPRSRRSDADYQVSVDDLQRAEAAQGPIPATAILLLRTGFSQRWPDAVRYLGTADRGDGARRASSTFPGCIRRRRGGWSPTAR